MAMDVKNKCMRKARQKGREFKRYQYRELQINEPEAQDLGCKRSGVWEVTGGDAT